MSKAELEIAISEFRDSDETGTANALCDGAEQFIKETEIVLGDLGMIVRMMVYKHRKGKLNEEYCLKAIGYLQRKKLNGSFLREVENL